MTRCSNCQQPLGEALSVCPLCGTPQTARRTHIDEYILDDFVNEGPDCLTYKAHTSESGSPTFLRLFKPEAGITAETAGRLRAEIDSLRGLPGPHFVHHHAVCCSTDGEWYRVSEWLDAVKWGDLIGSGYFLNYAQAAELFAGIAEGMQQLHERGLAIPHLTLDDLLAVRDSAGGLSVRIDYKFSRLIDPALPNPRPGLAALLAVHPDLRSGRPLDFRSDVWSMGRVFAHLLTGEDDVAGSLQALDAAGAPARLKVLLHQMLESSPEERPATASVIAQTLRQVAAEEVNRAAEQAESRAAARRPKLLWAAFALLAIVAAAAVFIQLRYGSFSRDAGTRLSRLAESHHGAVAFTVVAYALEVDGKEAHRQIAEGTAFLVTDDGYLLTNRHVACPWLEDSELAEKVAALQDKDVQVQLKYSVMLWFDGQRAVRRGRADIPSAGIDDAVEDRYFTQNAYRSGGTPSVRIAGILPEPRSLRERLRSPLGDDLAFLKIDQVPAGVRPIKLPSGGMARPKPLESIMVLGFPLGSDQLMGAEAVASATMGNVRRSFENVHQISASIHHGNSGGPVINADGRLLGIASASAQDSSTPDQDFSDFGMVLPAERAVPLLNDLQAGRAKWDGVPYYGLTQLSVHVARAASDDQWSDALKAATAAAATNRDPRLLELLALTQYGHGAKADARATLDRAVAETPEETKPRLLRFALEWRDSPQAELKDSDILSADWHSPAEFSRFCYQAMRGEVAEPVALDGWEDSSEHALLLWIAAVRNWRAGRRAQAANLLTTAISEAGLDTPEQLLALAELKAIGGTRTEPAPLTRQAEIRQMLRTRLARAKIFTAMRGESEENQIAAMRRLVQADPDDAYILVECAFREAGQGTWEHVTELLDVFASRNHRVSALSLSAWLLRAEALAAQGDTDGARRQLEHIAGQKNWPWYPQIARDLLGQSATPIEQSAHDPAEVLTLAAARGLWAEARQDARMAATAYRAGLDSYLSTWAEYELASTRLTRLRTSAASEPAAPEEKETTDPQKK